MPRKIDLMGKTFGRLTVIGPAANRGIHTRWLCRCDCGKEKVIQTSALRQGLVVSCGCYRDEVIRRASLKHGGASLATGKQTRLYRIWKNMKSRCGNKNVPCFHRYGGAGISICDQWAESFLEFKMWATANGYKDHLTIDRVDGTKGYSPENCRWATYSEQCENRKKRGAHSRVRGGKIILVRAQSK